MPQSIAITHVMQPVLPGAYAVLTVGGMTDETKVYASRVENAPPGSPGDPIAPPLGEPAELTIVQRQGECLTVDVPAGAFAALALSLSPNATPAEAVIVNRPRLDWAWPSHATPGGTLYLVGRNLVSVEHYPTANREKPTSYGRLLSGKTRVVARLAGGEEFVELPVRKSSAYEAVLDVPADLPPGSYDVFAHNGLGGSLGWADPIPLEVRAPEAWPDDVFRVDDYLRDGVSADDAIAEALAAVSTNGGGVIEFSAGSYWITRTIVLPRRTVLRGAGRDLTWLRLPVGDGPKPPYVAITGDGDFTVEDLWVDAVHAPILICAPTFLPATFDEAFRPPFSWSELRARDVTVRRCHLAQHILQSHDRRSDTEQSERMKNFVINGATQTGGGFNSVLLRGDGLVVEDNFILAGGSGVTFSGCSSAHVAHNTIKAGAAGHALYAIGKLTWPPGFRDGSGSTGATIRGNYSHEFLVHDNVLTAHCIMARDLFYFYGGGVNCHVARNDISDIEKTYDAEAFGCHLWMARWTEPTIRMTGPTSAEIIDPTGEVARECLDDAVLDVVAGRGVGQMRRIVRRDGSLIEIDRPWTVEPDETSDIVFTAPSPFHKFNVIDNRIVNVGANIIFWGTSNDIVIDGNYVAEGPGILVFSVRLAGKQKVWGGAAFSQIINNTAAMGAMIYDPCSRASDCTDEGFDMLGLIIRNNAVLNQSQIIIQSTYPWTDTGKLWRIHDAGIVVENNFCKLAGTAISIEKGSMTVERGNSGEQVKNLLMWTEPRSA